MNLRLKARIVECFGSQAEFSTAIGRDETLVSRIVKERRVLSPTEQREWARRLKCQPEQIFPVLGQPVIPDLVMAPQQDLAGVV